MIAIFTANEHETYQMRYICIFADSKPQDQGDSIYVEVIANELNMLFVALSCYHRKSNCRTDE